MMSTIRPSQMQSPWTFPIKSEDGVSAICYPVLAPSTNIAHEEASVAGGEEGVTRVPCKARGVANGHNARNAYIEIPANPTHGLILICSNPDCYKSGRKFRYCAVCETPVAKRNFMVRHGHGIGKNRKQNTTTAAAAAVLPSPDPAPAPIVPSKRRRSACVSQDSTDMAAIAKQAISELQLEEFEDDDDDEPIPPSVSFSAAEAREQGSPPRKAIKLTSSEPGETLSAEETAWLALLRNRPTSQDANETKQWFESVMQFSVASDAAPLDFHTSCDFSFFKDVFDNASCDEDFEPDMDLSL